MLRVSLGFGIGVPLARFPVNKAAKPIKLALTPSVSLRFDVGVVLARVPRRQGAKTDKTGSNATR